LKENVWKIVWFLVLLEELKKFRVNCCGNFWRKFESFVVKSSFALGGWRESWMVERDMVWVEGMLTVDVGRFVGMVRQFC
jgi:hypothetical protein